MKRNEYKLFSEGRISHLTVKNRLIRSATFEGGVTGDGRVTPEMLNLYRNLAEGGVGTIITGHMAVRREGQGHDRQICIYDDCYIAEIAKILRIPPGTVKSRLHYARKRLRHYLEEPSDE